MFVFQQDSGEVNGAGVYRGSAEPATKECLLIYDEATGEMSLELVATKIRVKMARWPHISFEGMLNTYCTVELRRYHI